MTPTEPKSWFLCGGNGWNPAAIVGVPASTGVSIDPVLGIRLAGVVSGPFAFGSCDGSLGGLLLPGGMAIDGAGLVYLLNPADPDGSGPRIRRFVPSLQAFMMLPGIGGSGADPRQFLSPRNIAIVASSLYLADSPDRPTSASCPPAPVDCSTLTGPPTNRRVVVFDVQTLAIRHLFGPRDSAGHPVAADAPDAWEPYDVAAGPHDAFILDRRHGTVYRHRPGSSTLSRFVASQAQDHWDRIAVDNQGYVYLVSTSGTSIDLAVFDPQGRQMPPVPGQEGTPDPGSYRSRFTPPPLRLDYRCRFCLPASLARACDRSAPQNPPTVEDPLAACRTGCGGLVFDRQGRPAVVAPGEPPGPVPYQYSGSWLAAPLDSKIDNCQWHRVVVSLLDLPPGATVTVYTTTSNTPTLPATIAALQLYAWDFAGTVTGKSLPPKARSKTKATQALTAAATACPPPAPAVATPEDFFVQSLPGEFLWLRLDLSSDGYGTPAVGNIRVHYPRISYLQHLPAVFSSNAESTHFLEQFLSAFQTAWDAIDGRISRMRALFDPKAVPDKFLDYLAGWLSLPNVPAGDRALLRDLVEAAPAATGERGTVAALRALLGAYLQSFTGIAPTGQGPFPMILEGFRERQRLMLSRPGLSDLGSAAAMWGAEVVGRLQLGKYSQEGQAKLVSAGNPQWDEYNEYAHRFRVVVPAAWVRTAANEQSLRTILDSEKPAHTRYDLCLVEPRFRIGVQSTVGVDAMIAGEAATFLACASDEVDPRPIGPPAARLGFDTLLSCPCRQGKNASRPWPSNPRLDLDTILA